VYIHFAHRSKCWIFWRLVDLTWFRLSAYDLQPVGCKQKLRGLVGCLISRNGEPNASKQGGGRQKKRKQGPRVLSLYQTAHNNDEWPQALHISFNLIGHTSRSPLEDTRTKALIISTCFHTFPQKKLQAPKRCTILSLLVKLQRQKNMCPDISNLPDDVLIAIFRLSRNTTINPRKAVGEYMRDQTKVSHICHYWRVLSINTPHLWNTVRCLHRDWNAECLARSGGVPITMEVSVSDLNSSIQTKLLLERYMPRLAHLTLYLCTIEGSPPLLSLALSRTAELLESLSLECFKWQGFPLKGSLFGGICPSLRRVSLDSCSFEWEAMIPSFYNLTHLEIGRWIDSEDRSTDADMPLLPTTVDDVTRALSSIPNLSTLKL
jgi:hypothetical protein